MTPEDKFEKEMLFADLEYFKRQLDALASNPYKKVLEENRRLFDMLSKFEDLAEESKKVRSGKMDQKVP